MQGIREGMRRRPVRWFFAIAMASEILVISVLLFSGALAQLEAAIETVWGGRRGPTSSRPSVLRWRPRRLYPASRYRSCSP